MIFIRALLNEIKKNTVSIVFLISAAAVAVLCFASGIYTDPINERAYSVFECMFTFDSELIKSSYEFSSVMVFLNGMNEYLLMFMPVLAAVSYIRTFSSELESTFYRYELFRTQKKSMVISKFCGGLINGGITALVGMILYGLVVWIVFPNFDSYQVDIELREMLFSDSMAVVIINRLAGVFLYGMFSAVLPVLLSAVIRNIYVVLCLPFMVTYLYNTTLNKITLSDDVMFDTELFSKVQLLYPKTVIYVFENPSAVNSLLLNLAFLLVAFGIYAAVMIRKGDS